MNAATHMFIGRFPRKPHIIPAVGKNGTKLALFKILNNTVYKDANGKPQTIVTAYPCSAWGKMADLVEQYCDEGKEVCIKADFRTNYDKDKDVNHMTFRVREIDFGRDSQKIRNMKEAANKSAAGDPAPQVPTDPQAQLDLLQKLTDLAAKAGIQV